MCRTIHGKERDPPGREDFRRVRRRWPPRDEFWGPLFLVFFWMEDVLFRDGTLLPSLPEDCVFLCSFSFIAQRHLPPPPRFTIFSMSLVSGAFDLSFYTIPNSFVFVCAYIIPGSVQGFPSEGL